MEENTTMKRARSFFFVDRIVDIIYLDRGKHTHTLSRLLCICVSTELEKENDTLLWLAIREEIEGPKTAKWHTVIGY